MKRQQKAQENGQPSTRDTLMTVGEVAQQLRLTDMAVRNLIYRSQLQAYYMAGRRIRVKRSDLDAFLVTQLRPA
jgi:excisionase family DNA binding protein